MAIGRGPSQGWAERRASAESGARRRSARVPFNRIDAVSVRSANTQTDALLRPRSFGEAINSVRAVVALWGLSMPPTSGGHLRAFNLIDALTDVGEVDLVFTQPMAPDVIARIEERWPQGRVLD